MSFQIIIFFLFYRLDFQITKPDIFLQTLFAWNFVM